MQADSNDPKLNTEKRQAILQEFDRVVTPFYAFLDDRRREPTRKYLTTDATLGDLARDAGLKDVEAARYRVTTGLEQLFSYLPQDVKEIFGSPQEVYRLKAWYLSHTSRQRWRESNIDPETGTFKNLSEAASRRWQREREAHQQSTQAQELKEQDAITENRKKAY
jgi:hypothetical protein